MGLMCKHCGKRVESGHVIDGEAIHSDCEWDHNHERRSIDIEALYNEFVYMDTETLDDLYEEYVITGTFDSVDDLIRELKEKWVVITRGLDSNDNGEISFEVMSSKTKVCKWLARITKDNICEDNRSWEMTYILSAGEIKKGWNDFTIKISF